MNPEETEAGPCPKGQGAAPRERRVLVAEDDPEMRRLVCRALRRVGYRVVEVEDGRALVNTLIRCVKDTPEQLPDLIISDVRMPGCTGLEVLARMRRVEWSTPVILITAFGDMETHSEAHRLGAARVLDKPFDVDELCSAARTLVPTS